jgi:uncharacterized membrane protein
MNATKAEPRRRQPRRPYLVRLICARPRLFGSAVVALVLLLVLPAELRLTTRLLVAWDVGVALYLALACHMVMRSQVDEIRSRAAIQDEGRIGILVLTAAAAIASFGAIIAELGSSAGNGPGRQPRQLILATVTILLSWAFTHTIFALHYAHEFYTENGGRGGGLLFPGNDAPDYWDFVYFSFVIGMTSQVSDVAISCKPIRRTVAAHGVLSFVFNAALLALTVNIAASAI